MGGCAATELGPGVLAQVVRNLEQDPEAHVLQRGAKRLRVLA
jgi:hypothetical protein